MELRLKGAEASPITVMASTILNDELKAEISAVAQQLGCELLHSEFSHGTLRVFLDRPDGGVTLADCETVSREISAFLDVTDFGDRRYTLEVSSPGLDRELYGPRDYERFCGELARVSFRDTSGTPKTVTGRIAAYRPASREGEDPVGGEITLVDDADVRLEIALSDIRKANLEIEL